MKRTEAQNALNFTTEAGIKVQTEQLARWATVLKPEVFHHVEKIAKANNDKANDGFDIFRGVDIDQLVSNIAYNSVNMEETVADLADFADTVYEDDQSFCHICGGPNH